MAARKTSNKTPKKKAPAKKKAAELDFSDPIRVPAFGKRCSFLFEADEEDPKVLAAVNVLLAAKPALLASATTHLVHYCKDMLARAGDEAPRLKLQKPADVWKYVQLGDELVVSEREDDDDEDGIYFSLECNCDWEPEHGLQIVIRDGKRITKLGPFDGHVTNADAYDDRSLVGVVYKRRGNR